MKSLRLILSLAFTSLLVTAVQAVPENDQPKEKSATTCDCGKDKDGKECGKDKECCCKPKDEKKEEPKK